MSTCYGTPPAAVLPVRLNEIAEPVQRWECDSTSPADPTAAKRSVGACEILGFDPLYVANEGKCIAIVAAESADKVLEAMRSDPTRQEGGHHR